jgi:hypothetical protein
VRSRGAFSRNENGAIIATVGDGEAVFTMTPEQYRAYLTGPATYFDFVAIDGVEKSLHTASNVAPDGGLMQ